MLLSLPHPPRRVAPRLASAASLLLLLSLPLLAADSLPVLQWDINTDRPAAYKIQLYSGESLHLQPRFLSYGSALNLSNATDVSLRYYTADMTSSYYCVTGSVLSAVSGRVDVVWSPTAEGTNSAYLYNLVASGSSGALYRAFGSIAITRTAAGSPTVQPSWLSDWLVWLSTNLLGTGNVSQAYVDAQDVAYTNALALWAAGQFLGLSGTASNSAALDGHPWADVLTEATADTLYDPLGAAAAASNNAAYARESLHATNAGPASDHWNLNNHMLANVSYLWLKGSSTGGLYAAAAEGDYLKYNRIGATSDEYVWTSGHDGTGSGLDADLLDGSDSTDFAPATHNHDATYLGLHATADNAQWSASATSALSSVTSQNSTNLDGSPKSAFVQIASPPTVTTLLAAGTLFSVTNAAPNNIAWLRPARADLTVLWIEGAVLGGGSITGSLVQSAGTNLSALTYLQADVPFTALYSSNAISTNPNWTNGNWLGIECLIAPSGTNLAVAIGGAGPLF